MHEKSVSESDGRFGEWRPSSRPCRSCGGPVVYSVRESPDGWDEAELCRCERCGETWWVDGIDS